MSQNFINSYTLLSCDLSELVDSFENGTNRTAAQEVRYPHIPRGKRIAHAMFGKNHENTLCLLMEDGGDGKPLLKRKIKSAENVWDNNTLHTFLTTAELIRIGKFFQQDFYRVHIMCLKGIWEKEFAEYQGYKQNISESFLDLMMDAEARDTFSQSFNPDMEKLYEQLEKEGNAMVSEAGYDAKNFETLTHELLLNKLHWMPLLSGEVTHFVNKQEDSIKLLSEGTPEEQEDFWIKKSTWVILTEEVGHHLFTLENKRLEIANINNDYMAVFGDAEVAFKEQVFRLDTLSRRKQFKEDDPKLTKEDLDQKLYETEQHQQTELEKLREEALTAIPCIFTDTMGFPISDDELSDFERECKIVLRDIYFLLHPDYLKKQKSYPALSQPQKDFLKNRWHETMKIKKDLELGMPNHAVNHKYRQLAILKDILAEVKATLDHAGLDVDVNYQIEGETIHEKLAWLENAIHKLEKEIGDIKAEKNNFLEKLLHDEELKRMRQYVSEKDKREERKADLFNKAKELAKEADQLEAELEALFEEVA